MSSTIDDYCYARYPVGSDFYMAKAQNKRQLMLDDEKQQGEKEGQRITKWRFYKELRATCQHAQYLVAPPEL